MIMRKVEILLHILYDEQAWKDALYSLSCYNVLVLYNVLIFIRI